MSAPATIHTDVYFVQRDGASCDREVKPTFAAGNLLGEIESVTFRNDTEVQKYQKWNADTGRHVDHTVFPVQEVLTATIVCRDLSPTFWKLLRRANFSLTTSGTFKYGTATSPTTIGFPGEGWIRFVSKDQRTVTLEQFDSYGYLEVPEHGFARGVQSVTFNWTQLYSALHYSGYQGSWTNIL